MKGHAHPYRLMCECDYLTPSLPVLALRVNKSPSLCVSVGGGGSTRSRVDFQECIYLKRCLVSFSFEGPPVALFALCLVPHIWCSCWVCVSTCIYTISKHLHQNVCFSVVCVCASALCLEFSSVCVCALLSLRKWHISRASCIYNS